MENHKFTPILTIPVYHHTFSSGFSLFSNSEVSDFRSCLLTARLYGASLLGLLCGSLPHLPGSDPPAPLLTWHCPSSCLGSDSALGSATHTSGMGFCSSILPHLLGGIELFRKEGRKVDSVLGSTNEITDIIEDPAWRKFNLRPIPPGRRSVYFHRFM